VLNKHHIPHQCIRISSAEQNERN